MQLFVFSLALFSSTALMAQPANDDCANAIAITVGTCPADEVAGDNTTATDDGFFSCDAAGQNAGLWYSFVAPASGAVTLFVTDGGPGNPEAAVFDGCGGTEVACNGAPDNMQIAGLTSGNTYLVVVWGDVTFGQGPFTICAEEFIPEPNDICSGATPLTVGACPANEVAGNTLDATDDGFFSCDAAGGNAGLWYSFTAPASGAVFVTVTDGGPGNPEAAMFDGCGGAEIWCDFAPDGDMVTGLTSGNTYYIIVWGDVTFGQGPFTICVDEFIPAPNDDCADAIDVPVNTSASGNTGTGTDSNPPACGGAGDGTAGGLWYTVTGTGLDITAATCGSSFDTQIAVYSGSCGGLNCVAGNDDGCGLQSSVTWLSMAGVTYYVYVDGFGSNSGNFTLDVSGIIPPPVPNDLCALAEPIGCGETVNGFNIAALPDPEGDDCGADNAASGVWYTFTAGDDARFYSLSTCESTDFATEITVFSGECEELVCLGGSNVHDDCDGNGTELIFTPVFGGVHYVLVEGVGNASGTFDLTLNCDVEPLPSGCTDPTATNYDPDAVIDDGSCVYDQGPSGNDDCAGAIPVSCGETISGSTAGATFDNVGFCGTSNTTNGVWYSIVGDGNLITASTCNQAAYDTKISVFTGTCGALSCLTGLDDAAGCAGFTTELSFPSTAGVTYYILIHGFGTATGTFDLTITCTAPPAGDDCAGGTPISCGDTVNGSTTGASNDNAGFCGTSNTAPGVWYTLVGDGSFVTASTCNQANYDTKISVYSGSCASLSCVAGNDDTGGCGGFTTELSWLTSPGVTYNILVHGFGTASGDFTLSITCVPPPDNDDCADAFEISCNTTVTGSTQLASSDTAPTCDGVSVTAPGVWYTFVGSSRIVNLNTCGSSYDTKLSVYTGSCGDLVCLAANDDFCGLQSSVTFVPEQGEQYYVLVHGFGSATGNYSLEYDCRNPLPRPQVGNQVVSDVAVSLYPNPAVDELNVQLDGFSGDQAMIVIHNSLGQLMMERRIDQVENPVEQFNTSQLQSGMYFLTVFVEGKGKFTEKFMVGAVRP